MAAPVHPHRRLRALVGTLAAAAVWVGAADAACPEQHATPAYTRAVTRALASGRDVLGEQLLRTPGGPTYARAAGFLHPLLYARTSKGRKLTDSGVYYLPFTIPGSGTTYLHVADGGEIVARRVGGKHVAISVGGERYGSCVARLATPSLGGGWLPILVTRYVDAHGVRYRQESFAAKSPASGRLVAFVRLTGAGRLQVGALAQAGGTLYASWDGRARRVSPNEYEAARRSVETYWRARLDEGASFEVPERVVMDAERALLVQNLSLGWRYSVGNPYEEFSWPESIDDAQVLDEYGFPELARDVVRTSLDRRPTPYPNWKIGEKLLAVAADHRLTRDAAFVSELTPTLRRYLDVLGSQLDDGLLDRERYSSDIGDLVNGLHGQAVVWQGLSGMAAAWAETADTALAARARTLAARLEAGLRDAVRRSQRRLADGSLFVPVRLLDPEPAYQDLTASRGGSYWNLVMPYALASGLFAPDSPEARGVLRYMRLHGSRLLGLVRAGAFALYRDPVFPVSGTDQVYGLNVARFLADAGESDQLVLSLYGQLTAGMTPGTFVAGEGATVAPLDGARYRAMYLPPNSTSNAAFLETLRQLLVHESATGLDLAFSTPRAWLAPGRRIAVRDVPTRFGPLSYSLEVGPRSVHVSVAVPARTRPRTLRLRLRLPGETRTLDLSGRTGDVELEVGYSRRTS